MKITILYFVENTKVIPVIQPPERLSELIKKPGYYYNKREALKMAKKHEIIIHKNSVL